MSFKRGNIVKYKTSFWNGRLGESQDIVNELGVIEYSYGEKYGNGECYGGYSVIKLSTGCSSAWWDDEQLEFVEIGGENIIEECKKKLETISQQMSDLKWIKENWSQNKFSTITMLTLFNEIKYKSSFVENGEFFILDQDWNALYPIFNAIFNEDYTKMIEEVEIIFKPEYKEEKLKVCIDLFNKIRSI